MAADNADTARRLTAVGVSTAGGSGATCLAARIRTISGLPLAGPAYPVACAHADNLAIHVALLHASPGSILVIDASSAPDLGYWGEVLTVAAQVKQLGGVIIDGSVRDVDRLIALGFPVYATGVAAAGTTKARGGAVGLPTIVGDVKVVEGDWVLGDADGVALVPRDQVGDVVVKAENKVRWERNALEAIRGGASTVELFELEVDRVATEGR